MNLKMGSNCNAHILFVEMPNNVTPGKMHEETFNPGGEFQMLPKRKDE